jgi:Protein of unknown function (DUF1214)
MYGEHYAFVANPLNRYSISARQNLKSNPDGSTDLYIQNQTPVLIRSADRRQRYDAQIATATSYGSCALSPRVTSIGEPNVYLRLCVVNAYSRRRMDWHRLSWTVSYQVPSPEPLHSVVRRRTKSWIETFQCPDHTGDV